MIKAIVVFFLVSLHNAISIPYCIPTVFDSCESNLLFPVPDAIVGAVLGQKAKTLQDIQHFSGCKVEVHKRGSATPQGVRLITCVWDVVTRIDDCRLTGTSEHVRVGRGMIEKVINDEQSRRAQQQHHSRGGFI